ncbi:hypothetical protein G6F43_014311 [Rhizopus delemar]|nr:hypothetical protein G6F43_014311 [Rhizopus delemar]
MRKWVARVENDSTGGMPTLMRRGRTASPRISAAHTIFIERLLEEHGEYSLERIALLLQEEFPVDFETMKLDSTCISTERRQDQEGANLHVSLSNLHQEEET